MSRYWPSIKIPYMTNPFIFAGSKVPRRRDPGAHGAVGSEQAVRRAGARAAAAAARRLHVTTPARAERRGVRPSNIALDFKPYVRQIRFKMQQ